MAPGIADISIHVFILRSQITFQRQPLPARGSPVAEKVTAQIIVDPHDLKPLRGEMAAGFRAN